MVSVRTPSTITIFGLKFGQNLAENSHFLPPKYRNFLIFNTGIPNSVSVLEPLVGFSDITSFEHWPS